jgi:hypothetical protein
MKPKRTYSDLVRGFQDGKLKLKRMDGKDGVWTWIDGGSKNDPQPPENKAPELDLEDGR